MDMTCDKILVIAKNHTRDAVIKAVDNISGLGVIETDSENKAFELIFTNDFALAVVDETLKDINIYNIGSMLLSHKSTHNIPLLIITDDIQPEKFLHDFKALQVDYMAKPVSKDLMQARIQIFFDLFTHKNAVMQSMAELDLAYKKVVAKNDKIMHQELLQKELANKSSIAATQMQQALPKLRSNIRQLMQQKDIRPETKTFLSSVENAAGNISNISNKLFVFKEKGFDKDTFEQPSDKTYNLLYAQGSNEEYNIFNHCLRSALNYNLVWSKTVDDALYHIGQKEFDLIFTDQLLPDATGFDLLSRLKQIRSETPVIFAFSKSQSQKGSQAISKGAYNFFLKEDISTANLISIINNTLQKSKISRQAEAAMNRVVMIAQKDTLTKLYTPQYFEKTLGSELSKAGRYQTDLSILIIHFDTLKTICSEHTSNTADTFLSTSAAIIQNMIRASDTACRFTNEKFALILPHTNIDGAGILARRINEKISHYRFTSIKKTVKLTVSIGAAQFKNQKGADDTMLLENSFTALETAINEGGDTVKLFKH